LLFSPPKKNIETFQDWVQTMVDLGYPVAYLPSSRKISGDWAKSVFCKL
jgi:hypothetical protein